MAGIMSIKTASENAEVDYSLQRLLDTPGGLERLAQDKLPPFIRQIRDYEAFGRKVLFTHEVSETELQLVNGEPYMYYPKDFTSEAAFYADDGEVEQFSVEGDGVNVGIFTVASNESTINLKRLMVQKYNYLERVRELSGQMVGMAEDTKVMSLVNALIAKNPAQSYTSTNPTIQISDLVAGKKLLSVNDVPVGAYVMNPSRIDDLLALNSTDIDQLTMREMMETGVRYRIWGTTNLVTSRAVPPDTIYVFAEKEFVGRMPVLKDITIRLTETANKLEKGLFLFEFLGIYIASQLAVGTITMA